MRLRAFFARANRLQQQRLFKIIATCVVLAAAVAGFVTYAVAASKQQGMTFVANPNYFREQPFFGRVVYRAVPSGASRVTLLRAGQVLQSEAGGAEARPFVNPIQARTLRWRS